MSGEQVRVLGGAMDAQARAVAGRLAELGCGALALVDGAGWRRLGPRETDLPGVIVGAASAGGGELVCLDRPLRIEIGPTDLRWCTTDPALADACPDPTLLLDD